ncbi:TDT family transporter [Flammeovirga kamogawensis]|uniref:TDT family transporter n=1 Tax=Flammeovirga kamogawensis TaxID=373891 RepID=A0ABX8GX59_9BACT|nr:TDT family transporter [Flammeovirga kamogawensis]MBB6461547.1 tellurite resistance protein TehA-like permease [Flammeovirga kamogawensis]QWG07520.1 TDT family transporter [Flammeovirga kamogawensis]TRX69334.1 TDT family transporter [Flammeovirga kamogawensis]
MNTRNLPIGLGGVALGTLTLGIAWNNMDYYLIYYLTIAISIAFFGVLIVRNIFHFDLIINELKHPILGSFVPTFSMVMMVLSGILVKQFSSFGKILWLSAIIIHLLILVIFSFYQLKEFKISSLVPSWFIPPIGIVVACVNSTNMEYPNLVSLIWWVATPLYFLILLLLFYRLSFYKFEALETFGIMAAPASLCFAGYLTIESHPNDFICHVLLTLAIFMTLLLYISFFKLLKYQFNPSFAAYTFPLAIGVVALQKYSYYLIESGEFVMGEVIRSISNIELIIASVLILYVIYKYFFYCIDELFKPQTLVNLNNK